MSLGTYGDHQEAAAAALNALISGDDIPTDEQDLGMLGQFRRAAIDALCQRLHGLGLSQRHAAGSPWQAGELRLDQVNPSLPDLVSGLVFELRTPADGLLAPSDTLTRESAHTTVRMWREAAIELLAASHLLDVAPDQPWTTDDGLRWHLIKDIAVSTEAILVLDSRLREVGVLPGPSGGYGPGAVDDRRLLASQCARVATWYATSDSPDVIAGAADQQQGAHGPVQVVARAADFAPAQRRLAEYLRPVHAHDSFYSGDPVLNAATTRIIVASQIYLLQHFELMAARTPGANALVPEFESRRQILEAIQTSMAYLVDTTPSSRNMRAVGQLGELTSAVRRFRTSTGGLRLEPAELLDLAAASHTVTHNAARTLRRELLRDTSILRIADPTQQVGPTQVLRYHPLERHLTDLINVPPPSTPVATYSSPLQRAALRQTLDVTPTTRAHEHLHRVPRPVCPRSLDSPDAS